MPESHETDINPDIYTVGNVRISVSKLHRELEKILHPYPTFRGAEIRHRHQRSTVIFTAWKEDVRINDRNVVVGYLMMYRTMKVLTKKNLQFLVGK